MGRNSGNKTAGMRLHEETVTPAHLQLVDNIAASSFSHRFFLVGGTALSLHLGHRQSIDFDFFSTQEFEPYLWLPQINELGTITSLEFSRNSLICRVNGIKLMLMYFGFEPKGKFTRWRGIDLASIEDIALFKMLAIIGRNLKKDIIDLYFIDQNVTDLTEIVKRFKYYYSDSEINLLKQVGQLFDHDEIARSDNPVMLTYIDWETAYDHVKAKVIKAIKEEIGI